MYICDPVTRSVRKNWWHYYVRTAGGSNSEAEAYYLSEKPKFAVLEILLHV